MSNHSNEPQVVVLPPDKEKIRHLWKVAGILLLITIFEFIIALRFGAKTLCQPIGCIKLYRACWERLHLAN